MRGRREAREELPRGGQKSRARGGRSPLRGVLDEDGDEEPEDDFAAHYGAVEGGDLAGILAVVVWEAEEEDKADSPEYESDWNGDAS